MKAIKSENDDVCLQGIEFWSNVCEEEMDLSIELTEVSFHPHPVQIKTVGIYFILSQILNGNVFESMIYEFLLFSGTRNRTSSRKHQQVLR